MEQRVTLRDIAKRAGVHYTTVARALHNHPEISRETSERVKRAASEMGYVADPVLSALSAYRTAGRKHAFKGVLAWVTAFKSRRGWMPTRVYRQLYEGAAERAPHLGYEISEFWLTEQGMSPERASRILESRNVLGLIFAPLPEANSGVTLAWERFSALAIGFTLQSPRLHAVANHHFHSMTTLVAHVRSLGYRRPGLVLGTASDERVNHAWLAAFLFDHHRDLSGTEPRCFMPPRMGREAAGDFKRWFEASRPDAIIAREEYVLEWIDQLGLQVPGDVGFALLANDAPERNISGLDENPSLVGAIAVDLVAGMIHRGERGVPLHPLRHYVESSVVVGKTLRRQE